MRMSVICNYFIVNTVMIELLYILTSDWVLRTPNAGQNMLLNIFNAEKLKFAAKFGKKQFFKFAPKHWSQKNHVFIAKTHFHMQKAVKHFFCGSNSMLLYKLLELVSLTKLAMEYQFANICNTSTKYNFFVN